MSKSDIFRSHKGVHIKLRKDTHAALKVILFKKGLSIQEIVEEFTRKLVDGYRPAQNMMDDLVERKHLAEIERHKPTTKKAMMRSMENFGELDCEALYSLINGNEKREERRKKAAAPAGEDVDQAKDQGTD